MTPFPDTIRLEDAGMRGDSRVFRLTRRFRYYSHSGVIFIPEGFETDGASIPRIFWSLMEPFGPWFPAALVHDFLYSRASDGLFEVDRKRADALFLAAMKDCGVDVFRRRIMYSAVRSFGWREFKRRGQPDLNDKPTEPI